MSNIISIRLNHEPWDGQNKDHIFQRIHKFKKWSIEQKKLGNKIKLILLSKDQKIPLSITFGCNYISYYDKNGKEVSLKDKKKRHFMKKRKIIICEECFRNPADLPSKICVGCEAYKDHQK